MADVDSAVLASNPTVTTCLAAYLNARMSRCPEARMAYEATYGVKWCPLGNGCEINDYADSSSVTAR